MATGPEHYRQAEILLEAVTGRNLPSTQAMANVAAAQVHAELATAAALALTLATRNLPASAVQEWADVLSGQTPVPDPRTSPPSP